MLRCAALTSVEGGVGGVELGWQCGGFAGDRLGSGEAKGERVPKRRWFGGGGDHPPIHPPNPPPRVDGPSKNVEADSGEGEFTRGPRLRVNPLRSAPLRSFRRLRRDTNFIRFHE